MQLLITGGDCAQARVAVDLLRVAFQLRVVDTHFSSTLPSGVEQRTGDLREEAFVNECLSGVEAILHFAPLSLTLATDLENLDHTLLGSYRLAHLAQKQRIERIILGSSMNLFAAAPQHWSITADWRPQPQPHVADLCAYLGECTMREWARDKGVPVVCVRFGIADDSVANAIQQAFIARCNGWRILHAVTQSLTTPRLTPRSI